MSNLISVAELAQSIPDGTKLAIAKDGSGVSIVSTVALIERGIRDLHLVCVPTSGLQADLLIGAGCVATLETSAITLAEYGAAPRFSQAVKQGSIKLVDATCPAVYAGMQASQKGIPFIPLRGIIDSDLLNHRSDWQVIDNPFADQDPIVAIKAIDPQIALFHAFAADRFGNVFLGRDRDGLLLAHAARTSFVTVENILEGNLLDDPDRAGSVIPAMYIEGIAHVPQGSWPLPFGDIAPGSDEWMQRYVGQARDPQGFTQWIDDASAAAPWLEHLAAAQAH